MLSDHELGQRLGRLIACQEAEGLSPAEGSRRLLAQLQDLLGAETSLASPLRDLLLRPAFRELIDGSTTARAQRQQHLLQDLRHTYSAAVVHRLEAVLHGCLGEPSAGPGWSATAPAASSPLQMANAASSPAASPFAIPAPPSAAPASAMAHGHPAVTPASSPAAAPANQPSGALIAVIGLLAILTGGLVAALGWVLHLQRQPLAADSGAPAAPALQREAREPAAVITTAAAPEPEALEREPQANATDQRWQACLEEDQQDGAAPRSGETWWPVIGPADALQAARRHCRGDAFLNSQGNAQIASFRDRDTAQSFAATLTADSSHPWSFRVGEASVRP